MKIRVIVLLVVVTWLVSVTPVEGQEVCGGIAGIPCDAGEFCRLPDGLCCCDHEGVCEDIPETCTGLSDPVCGCDGVTYASRCHAAKDGVSLAWVGPCDEVPAVALQGFSAGGLLSWSPVPQASAYNVYLDETWGAPADFDGSCLYAGVPEDSVLLRGGPSSYLRWMFQVSALVDWVEGPLGRTSAGSARTPESPCTCTLPADGGPCGGYFFRWFHNYTTSQCEEFIWGGCEGNANNFLTPTECEAACMDPCKEPAIHGDCQAAIPRWYHNVLTGSCDPFVWGGCDPGANHFEARESCQETCGDICLLPPDPGDCDGVCFRWYFNPGSGECELFQWGCCEGNANNFPTQQACEAVCVEEIP